MTESITLESQAEDLYTSFAKREPAVLAHLVAGPLAGLFAFLITHGVITSTQASQATQWIVTTGITLAIAGQGFLVRRFVAPAWKVAGGDVAPLDEPLGDVGFEGEAAPETGEGFYTHPEQHASFGGPVAELTAPTSKPDLPPAPVGKHAAAE